MEKEIQSLEKEKDSFEKIHNDSLKVVEGMTSEICKEKEALMKKNQESLSLIEALRAENVSTALSLFRNISNSILKEKHKETLEQSKRSNRSAIENLERALVKQSCFIIFKENSKVYYILDARCSRCQKETL